MNLSFGRWAAAILTGALLALGTGLHPWPLALWIAPAPLLIASFSAGRFEVWVLGLLAGLISMVGLIPYYLTVAGPAAPAIVIASALVIAGLTLVTRGLARRSNSFLLPFAFPVLAAGLEMVVSAISPHSTAGSWSYSQMDWPVVLQVASLGGETAVVFVVTLAASTLAFLIARRGRIQAPVLAYGLPVLVIAGALSFGCVRIHNAPKAPTVRVGLVAIDGAKFHPQGAGTPSDATLTGYLDAAKTLADRGATIVLIPEKVEELDDSQMPGAKAGMGVAAAATHTAILAGFSLKTGGAWRNAAWLFGPDGKQYVDYDKHHMVPAFESKYRVGKTYPRVDLNGRKYGVAICKDMDFPELGRAHAGVNAMLVPAWDFKTDGWLHGRMAMLRSVESGFTLIRAARDGVLSVNDQFGRVIAERPSKAAPVSLLVADAPLASGEPTPFDQGGWMFGWVCAGVAALLLLATWWPRKKVAS